MAVARKINKKSANGGRLKQLRAPEDNDEIPPLDENFWAKAQMGSPLKKRLMSLRLDNDVVEWFKDQGASYQTRMN